MAATATIMVCTGTNAATETAATNLNLMSIDAYDSTGTDYQSNKIRVPESGTNYSYERWFRVKFTGTFNEIENVKVWHSAGTLGDANLDLKAGKTDTGATPTDSQSTIATTPLTGWDSEGEAIDITPAAGITSDGDETDYCVLQLEVPDTVTLRGDIGSQTITIQYDES